MSLSRIIIVSVVTILGISFLGMLSQQTSGIQVYGNSYTSTPNEIIVVPPPQGTFAPTKTPTAIPPTSTPLPTATPYPIGKIFRYGTCEVLAGLPSFPNLNLSLNVIPSGNWGKYIIGKIDYKLTLRVQNGNILSTTGDITNYYANEPFWIDNVKFTPSILVPNAVIPEITLDDPVYSPQYSAYLIGVHITGFDLRAREIYGNTEWIGRQSVTCDGMSSVQVQ